MHDWTMLLLKLWVIKQNSSIRELMNYWSGKPEALLSLLAAHQHELIGLLLETLCTFPGRHQARTELEASSRPELIANYCVVRSSKEIP